ncbi:RNA polymerase sigma factor [Fodinicola acaciae]|uniref:RNA polymerase sigma factor n=1 Tax=Fodinicola acaciae TaxID=2681555 RepID=UPI0013D33DAD|nr:RNA polymerase sigma factor [Fodinicola acaciae]
MRTRLRSGEPAAFRELFDAYAKVVYDHAFRLVGSWSTTEDAVSLTFLEAWRLRERIDSSVDASLQPWLLGIATNVCRNVRRVARRYDGALARLPAGGVVPDPADEVVTRLDGAEQVARGEHRAFPAFPQEIPGDRHRAIRESMMTNIQYGQPNRTAGGLSPAWSPAWRSPPRPRSPPWC